MKKCISLGNWNKYYLYIISIVIFLNITNFITGIGYHTYSLGLFDDNDHAVHTYIHKLFYYLFILIFTFLYFLFDKKRNSKIIAKLKNDNQNDNNTNANSFLIFNDIEEQDTSNISDNFAICMIFLFVLFEYIHLIMIQFFSFGDYWMVELIIMAYLNYKMFNIQIYEHQKLSLYLISIPIILKTITIVFFFCDENNYLQNGVINYKYNEKTSLLKSLFVAHWWLFPIMLIMYFIKMVFDAYIILNIKKVMDFKYVSVIKILILYSLFGISFSSIFSLITTFISCGKRNDEIYDIYDYICKVLDKNNDRFIESYKVYFTGDYGKDLLYTSISAIPNCIYYYFFFQTIKKLNPVYKSFCWPLIFLIQKLILISQINDDEPMKYLNSSFFIDFASDLSAVIIFLIFLEIVELNFCGLNRNLRKNIVSRSKINFKDYDISRDSFSDTSDELSLNKSDIK